MTLCSHHQPQCERCYEVSLSLSRQALAAEAEVERLTQLLHGLHQLVDERENHARAVMAMKGRTEGDLYSVVEGLIIDGADACTRFGPCPGCALRTTSARPGGSDG